MKKQIIIARHGESTSNIGVRADSVTPIVLSENGMRQAEALAELLPPAEAVVFSSYFRTELTALPFLKKFPDIVPEKWPEVREISFLSPRNYPNTTQEERIVPRNLFWDKNDPYYSEDELSESFSDFLARGNTTIEKLRDHPASSIVVFSHDIFIQLLFFIHQEKELLQRHHETEEGMKLIMKAFREKIRDTCIPNAVPIDISHIVS